ncbi:type IV pilin [Halorientalis pallida]|uniref:Type IV pilin n=1 Tax=Halorientalis pallida TaxID=2479928 RepID=A0A498L4G5_9EURY|nr:type IV pilin [Halorientalis pallida]RXK51514.1 type IV pilin [Halorientalis pallida]
MSDSRRRFRPVHDDRAVSNVVGVVLVVAVVVLLAAVVGNLALGFGGSMGTPAPQFTLESHYQADGAGNDADRPYLNITHTGGDTVDGTKLFVVDSDGNDVAWADVWTGGEEITATDYVHIDGHGSDGDLNAACGGETYQLIYRPDQETSHIVQEVEIERQATGPAATYC